MDMPVNTFKHRLRSGEAQIGLWLGLADAYCAELAANAGFDWLLIDGEHAPNDLRGMLGQLQAVAPYPSHPVIRPVVGDTALIKQVLDIGVQTLLVPMVESAAQARAGLQVFAVGKVRAETLQGGTAAITKVMTSAKGLVLTKPAAIQTSARAPRAEAAGMKNRFKSLFISSQAPVRQASTRPVTGSNLKCSSATRAV